MPVCTTLNTCFLWPTRVHTPISILISSALFAQLTAECCRACPGISYTLKLPLGTGQSWPPFNTWFIGNTRVHNPNGIRIVQLILHSLQQSAPIRYNGPPFPSNLSLPIWDHDPNLIHDSLGPSKPTNQMACQLVQSFSHSSWSNVPILYNGMPLSPLKIAPSYRGYGPHLIHGSWAHPSISIGSAIFAGLTAVTDRQTDWPTDHTTWLVTTGCIYVHSTTMQPNNKLPQRVKSHSTKQWQMRLFSNNAAMYIHRAINTGKDMSQARQILFTSECFNHCWVSGKKLESSEEVDQEFMMDDIIHTLTSLHNHVCKHTTTVSLSIWMTARK